MKIRPARLEDCETIARVHVDSWRTAYRGLVPDEVLDGLSVADRARARREQFVRNGASQSSLVAEDPASGIVGFSIAGPARSGPERYDGELYAIYLLASVRRRGLGRRLFAESVAALRAFGHRAMLVWVFEGNPPARAFYERMGGRLLPDKKFLEIGTALLPVVAYGWDELPAP
ncbi:MAG: GNAT family N-acetyltransferase [Elusimicrobia bacterium]|nr:GNAT family N-acetyltransferase [Elusimicrobiota bacterium]